MAEIIWCFKDGKRGHESQAEGLVEAIARLTPVQAIVQPVPASASTRERLKLTKVYCAQTTEQPNLLIGTGSSTHLPLLRAGQLTGAPTIVLMNPSAFIRRLFSCCVIPRHDDITGANVIQTTGALNRILPAPAQALNKGLILLGGPSKHHRWDSEGIVGQLQGVLAADPAIGWTLTTSPRTPADMVGVLKNSLQGNLNIVPFADTAPDWLPARLQECSLVWASEDSVSMVYEALSSGSKVGILGVPRKKQSSRIIRGLEELIRTGRVQAFQPGSANLQTAPAHPPLQEAARVAEQLVQRFLQ